MPLRIKCPTGHTLIVPDDRAGRTLQCPRCDQPVVVPAGEPDAFGSALLGVLAEGIHGSAPVANALRGARGVSDELASPVAVTFDRPASAEPGPSPGPLRHAKSPHEPVIKPKSRALPLLPPPPTPTPPTPQAPLPIDEQRRPDPLPSEPIDPPALKLPEVPALVAPPPAPQVKIEPAVARSAVAPPPIPAEEPEIEAPSAPAEPVAPPRFVPRDRGQEAATLNLHGDVSRTIGAYQLAAALAAAALFSVAPAVWDVVEYLQVAESAFVARWALALFFLGVVQLAYAVYLFQLPDWTTVWVVTLFSLFVAAVYAAVLGLVLLSPADGLLIGPHGLQLADKLTGGKAALWCLCMVSLATTLAFFAGRQSAAWYKAERMLRAYSPGV